MVLRIVKFTDDADYDAGENSGNVYVHVRPPNLRGREIGLWHAMNNKRVKSPHLRANTINETGINFERIKKIIQDFKFVEPSKCLGKRESVIRMDVSKHNPKDHCDEELIDMEELLDRCTCSNTGFDSNSLVRDLNLDESLMDDFVRQAKSSGCLRLRPSRERLPAYAQRQKIVSLISEHQIVVLSGATGSGKTTQVPQFILDDAVINRKMGSVTRIVVTQPRRISAISVAERVAIERGESTPGASIGYQVRLENRLPRRSQGSILYCTTGVVLQWLQSDPELRVSYFSAYCFFFIAVTIYFIASLTLSCLCPIRPPILQEVG
ncbi:unnamed protein product [Protopolystoma xenopodis]|uniref:Helicase ATP-binding domain-containing protein n=1 Tax=Protopolystoma xenopodis TaxID=117903 RepID=A0A3S5ATD8_9PLAT|nr:unnamed protein product [Protopolystoma xenopodis]